MGHSSLPSVPYTLGYTRQKKENPFVFAQAPDKQELEAAGVIASWFGILADYRGIGFPVSVGRIPTGNVIVIARNKSAMVASFGLEGSRGPSLAMRDNPSDRYGKILVVSGDEDREIIAAAWGLALGKSRFGDSATVDSSDIPPPRKPYDAPRWLSTDHRVHLGDFTSPEQLHVAGNGSVRLFFRLPPDLYFEQRIYGPLSFAVSLQWFASAGRQEKQVLRQPERRIHRLRTDSCRVH